MQECIPVYLITGFLGAGKTTLVNHLLAGNLGEEAGLLVNDFGDVVVDGSLVRRADTERSSDPDIFEVAGGSIFCSCKTDNFALGLRMFAKIRPRRLFIEASGMSDPSGFDKLLTDYRMAADFTLARVICLADAIRTPMIMDTLPALTRQVEAADLILINKSDLAEEPDLAHFEARLSSLNPDARILRTVRAGISADLLTGEESAHRRGTLESCNLPSNRPGTFQLENDGFTKDALDAFLHDNLKLTWRIKGWIEAEGRCWYLSDNAGSLEWNPEELPEGMLSGLTVITPADSIEAFEKAWEQFQEDRSST